MPLISRFAKKHVSALFAAGSVGLFAVGIATSPAVAAPASADGTIMVCHRTSSSGNTWVSIMTAKDSIVGSKPRDTKDIFPPFTYVDSKGNTITVPGENWDAAGQAIYATCAPPSSSPTPTATPTQTPSSTPTVDPTTPVPTLTQSPSSTPTSDPTTPAQSPSSTPTADPTTSSPATSTPAAPVTDPPSSAPTQVTSPTQVSVPTTAGDPPASSASPVAAADPANPGAVSLRAQTAAGAAPADYTTSNAFFAAAILMILGTLAPKFGRRRGEHE